MSIERPLVASAHRIVIKLGTRVLTHPDGRLALTRLFSVIEAVGQLRREGREVLVVSSGAVGLGRDALGLTDATELSVRQACAAVGQSRLMGLYEAGLSRLGLVAAQVLLTQADFADRAHYLNLRSTLMTLLAHGAVPIINENDVVAVDELAFGEGREVFGDNDRLSALVATKLGADLLVLLTDVDGVYERNPLEHPDARMLSCIDAASPELEATGSVSGVGRGGMRSKVDAAFIAARGGCHAVIASGVRPGALDAVLAGAEVGTWFPVRERLSARRQWIAWGTHPSGELHLDAGAVRALRQGGASLLAAGVTRVAGDFVRGDVVVLLDPAGDEVGRGIPSCDAATARAWARGERPDTARNHDALVHRDHLVLTELP